MALVSFLCWDSNYLTVVFLVLAESEVKGGSGRKKPGS
jgi:hypothetical protein